MSRRSVREFKDRPIAKETLEALLDVARRAPTASNSQKLHWIVVNDGAKVHALSVEAMNWLRTSDIAPAKLEQWERGYDFILRGAPTVIMACTPADYQWGKQDCAIALTFLELAAEARGLGACWAGYLTRVAGVHAPLRQALAVPEDYVVTAASCSESANTPIGWYPPENRSVSNGFRNGALALAAALLLGIAKILVKRREARERSRCALADRLLVGCPRFTESPPGRSRKAGALRVRLQLPPVLLRSSAANR